MLNNLGTQTPHMKRIEPSLFPPGGECECTPSAGPQAAGHTHDPPNGTGVLPSSTLLFCLFGGGDGGMNGKNGCVSSIFHHDFKKAVPPGY